MTAAEFRRVALSFPEAVEAAHMGHPDFRVKGKVFASLGPYKAGEDEDRAMVKLTPEHQAALVRDEPGVFSPASGAWGRWGCTIVKLKLAKKLIVRQALLAAWRNTAPKRLVEEHDGEK